MQQTALRFQKEGHCSYEAGKFHQTFGTRKLARYHAAADGQSRYAASTLLPLRAIHKLVI